MTLTQPIPPLDALPVEAEPSAADLYVASQWQLIARRFRKHRLAVHSLFVVTSLYTVALFCEFLAPYTLKDRDVDHVFAPPQRIHVLGENGWPTWPYVHNLVGFRNPETMRVHYTEDTSKSYPIRLFARGRPYHFWGLVPTERHLIGVPEGGTLYLLGNDSLGRDVFSRIAYGARISLTIGLIGVALSRTSCA